ncbi:RING finger protein 151-like [Mytilus trossulus]|uniref:RING finger protein 151-like n=1 Tax=Mytilus trossulus TaxID=6551 RepID=UPI003007316E
MGFDVDRFLETINEGLLCCICRDVLEDPVQAPCEHAYCRACIEGWLVHETICPEDRKPLSSLSLRPLFRYMRNDLNRLQIRCEFYRTGCDYISDLEFIHGHQQECPFKQIECTNVKCSTLVMRKDLQDHLKTCQFHAMECPSGCGYLMVTPEDTTHNCITELKTAMDVLRSEISCKYEEQKREMELRLNMQRSHMVQKEATMQSQIDDMKSEISKLSQKLKLMMDLEIQRRQDVEKLELEKKELMEVLRDTNKRENEPSSSASLNASVSHCKRCSPLHGKVTTI